jgi:hypothetical protein
MYMRIIEIAPLPNGAHRNLTGDDLTIPTGWAVIPEDVTIPTSFPFVEVTAVDGVVTELTEGIVPEPAIDPQERIDELKAQLTATDYKIIKCSEYQLLGLEMPYDIAELHAERQAIRDEINTLEQEV